MRADHPFAFFSSLFDQTLQQENYRPMLIAPEPGRPSVLGKSEGRRRLSPILPVAAPMKAGIVDLVALSTLEVDIPSLQGAAGDLLPLE